MTASTVENPPAMSCRRSSGGVSMRMVAPSDSTTAPARVRLPRGSVERHPAQPQPIGGTPNDVPVPRRVRRIFLNCFDLEEVGSAGHVKRNPRRHHQALTAHSTDYDT